MAIWGNDGVRSSARSMGLLIVALLVVINAGFVFTPTRATRVSALGGCQVVSISPNSVPDGSNDGFVINVVDNSDALAWIQVQSPSSNLTIVSANSDWLPNTAVDSASATFWGNSIGSGNTIEVDVQGMVSYFPPANWTILASTDQGGANPMTCTGNTQQTVTSTTPPQITNINVQALTTSATITWNTDTNANGAVTYGKTINYGGVGTDSSMSTGHQVILTGLTPATTYHYQVQSTDGNGNTAQSIDSTFFTASVPTSTTVAPPTSAPTTTPVTTPIGTKITAPSDTVPPTISLTSQPPHIVSTEPTFSGTAEDDVAVTKVEYSVDGGLNWLPADTVTGLGGKKVNFSFTTVNLSDDTYHIVARAIDGGGNTAKTNTVEVVLDREPPVMGGMVITLGPQVLLPDSRGVITTLPGIDFSVTLGSSGGVTSASIGASEARTPSSIAANFTLHRMESSGLWTGLLSFSKPGTYVLTVRATDGANTTSTRTIATINAVSTGNVLSSNGPIKGALLTVYCLDPDTDNWTVWDGQPYDQTNPQLTDKRGAYHFLLPSGTYYVHAEAQGYQDVNSERFTLTQPSPLTMPLHLQPSFGIGSIRLPWVNLGAVSVTTNETKTGQPVAGQPETLIGKSLPPFTLDTTAGTSENTVDWLGRPTIISILNSWSPSTAEQLPILEKLAANTDLNIKTIGLQENAPRLRALSAIAGSKVIWLADPNGQTAPLLNIGSVPTHYFIDRKGIIRSVAYGTMSYDQMMSALMDMQ